MVVTSRGIVDLLHLHWIFEVQTVAAQVWNTISLGCIISLQSCGQYETKLQENKRLRRDIAVQFGVACTLFGCDLE